MYSNSVKTVTVILEVNYKRLVVDAVQDESGHEGTSLFARLVTRGDVGDVRSDVGSLDLFAVSHTKSL